MSNPHFIPSTLLTGANALKVSAIILAGHPPTPAAAESDVYVNHWVIYLQLVQGGFICLDMSPNPVAHEPATLIVKRSDYNTLSDVVYQLPFPAVQTLYARHVLDRISAKGYHRYRYGDKMLECRYWANVVMKDFRDAGYIGGTGSEAYTVVSRTWGEGAVQLPKTPEWTQGTFG